MYGLCYKKPKWYCSLSTGLNCSVRPYWILIDPGPNRLAKGPILGIPVDMQFFLTGKKVGIGLNGFVVFHSGFISQGILMCLQIGKCR
jgi:hypothetical protein